MTNLNIQTLRRVALVGLAIVLLVDLISSLRLQSGLGLGVVVLLALILLVGLTSLVLMPRAASTLLSNKDLLMPLALVVFVGKLLGWLSAAPLLGALLKPSLPLHLFNLSVGLSLSFLLHIALAVAYATWMTAALLELERTGNGDPTKMLPTAPGRLLRVLGLEFIGWAVVMVATSVLLLLMPLMGFLALVPLAVFAVAWNYATAAILPVAMQEDGGFWRSFRAGVVASLCNLGKWWLLLLAQLLLLGLVFYYRSSSGGNTNVSWSVNVFWTGGYEDECRWYGKLAEATHTVKLPFVESLLTLLFGAFAVAIKLAIVQRLQPGTRTAMPPVAPAAPRKEGADPPPETSSVQAIR
jgi:hypothetical protein